jgi:hypothetical protein
MLTIEEQQRISILEIKQHLWVNEGYSEKPGLEDLPVPHIHTHTSSLLYRIYIKNRFCLYLSVFVVKQTNYNEREKRDQTPNVIT